MYPFYQILYFEKTKICCAIYPGYFLLGVLLKIHSSEKENVKIAITEEEAWLNLMPVVDTNKNIFGFLISTEFSNPNWGKNYSVKDFKIYT